MINPLNKTRTTPKADMGLVHKLYGTVMKLAREPVFYTRFQVPDTVDGRYDLMCLMLGLFLFRIQQAQPETAQALFDLAFKDIERGLRESGVGDLSVPKHMKRMLAAFYGRVAAYYEALEQQQVEGLAVILTRNLYNGDGTAPALPMAEWTRIAWQFLMQSDVNDIALHPDTILQLVPPREE
ncbi:MAG: hypothetical protein JWM96_868 [Alphaproteobacteria bacterium]|nr:hypothetical protein [Alphaproteobacteria bacterium]